MRRRTLVTVVLIGVSALLFVTTGVVLALTRSAGAGPFAWPSDAGSGGEGTPVKIGQFGLMTIPMPRTLTTPAVLLDVRPLHPGDTTGLTVRYAATTGRGLGIGITTGWNMRRYQLRPVPGFVIPAHARGGVTVGAESTHRGVHTLRGFILDYRIGGTHYSAPLYWALQICVGLKSCP